MLKNLPASWSHLLTEEFEKPYFQKLEQFVDKERSQYTIFPPEEDVFNALNYTLMSKSRCFCWDKIPIMIITRRMASASRFVLVSSRLPRLSICIESYMRM